MTHLLSPQGLQATPYTQAQNPFEHLLNFEKKTKKQPSTKFSTPKRLSDAC